ncbi:tetratricopeptide repeat protein [Brevundimonas sp. NPDC092305]|uniref:tetratricopeptide repeat protein n=1 Tax=Brevundimonas sp. NPDC092305 TaxID=3363957 RepID=UPI0037F1E6EA
MVDVFDQVEEELRSDRYKRLARTWLPVVGGVLLIALVAALGWWGYQSWQTSKADKASIAYQRGLESLQANNSVGADAAFAQAVKEGNPAYKALALNHRAGIAAADNRIPEAVALFDEAAKTARDPLLADYAQLKAVWLLMDTASYDDIRTRLEPLTKEHRPVRAWAQEALAMAQLQHGRIDEARSTLVVLKNGLDTPQIVGQRAAAALESIEAGTAGNLKAIDDAQNAAEQQARAAAEQLRERQAAGPAPTGPAASAAPAQAPAAAQ